MFKVIAIASLIAAFATIYNSHIYEYITNLINLKQQSSGNHKTVRTFTVEELKLYNGIHKKELYLSFLGNVFDVTTGSKHYGPGNTYNIFVGRDASRNFIDGKFNDEDTSDDVVGLQLNDFKNLDHWLKFYKKQYVKVGVLIGRYYNENGKLTQYGKEIRSLIGEALSADKNEQEVKRKYPPCNAEWSVDTGSKFWCTKRSGGIERDFIGFPRKFYEPGKTSPRCACISEENLNMGNIREYENCEPTAHSCYLKS